MRWKCSEKAAAAITALLRGCDLHCGSGEHAASPALLTTANVRLREGHALLPMYLRVYFAVPAGVEEPEARGQPWVSGAVTSQAGRPGNGDLCRPMQEVTCAHIVDGRTSRDFRGSNRRARNCWALAATWKTPPMVIPGVLVYVAGTCCYSPVQGTFR